MNVATVIVKLAVAFLSSTQWFKWRATVVSLSCAMSLKWPWNLVRMLFLVCPTYWTLQVLHVIT